MAIVIRTDLNMSVGKMIAQACHAAVGCSEEAKRTQTKHWRRWRDEGGKKVVLEADSMEELEELAVEAEQLNLPYVLIRDAGHTEVAPGTTTCIGIGPHQEQFMDKVTGNLPLL
ncbi:peptidyl-tRNA hydrolase [Candidatus Bathyarchaeota archaeon]|jgi:peptidyl-tRNA hydrolase, PTH2 family|nr:peptidyl-tRNA hydrolase [Candidatus Bathyarchaeota archaeon]